jgi:lipopolysaccharide export system ATP-binding protein
MAADCSLTASDLTVRLGGRTVVDRVSLRVKPGEVVGLLGPNGAGKTTIFRVILGLLRHKGSVSLGGLDLGPLPTHIRSRRGVGYLPQGSSVLSGLTVEQNVRLVLQLARRSGGTHEHLLALGLADRAKQLASTLSGGERRRLELACLLAADYDVVLLDEPFKGLDPLVVAELSKRIRSLASKGVGLLVTDHAVQQTLSLCDRAYILADGRLIAEGTAETLLGHPEAQSAFFGGSGGGAGNINVSNAGQQPC